MTQRPSPEGYCVKERKKVLIVDPQEEIMGNGRPAIKGTCPDCGTVIFKIGKLHIEPKMCPRCEGNPVDEFDYVCWNCRCDILVPA